MEESWIPYLNVIIAVHDVTAFGNTEFGKYTKFGKIPIFVYIYQILIISDPDETVFYYLLSSFSVKKESRTTLLYIVPPYITS